jgi:hypothetical protein
LQGTFSVYENLSAVYEFVKSCLTDENAHFTLVGIIFTRIQPEVDHSSRSLRNARNLTIHILFTDFEKVYNSIKHSVILGTLAELGCPTKADQNGPSDIERS